jgi:hypothetical protein
MCLFASQNRNILGNVRSGLLSNIRQDRMDRGLPLKDRGFGPGYSPSYPAPTGPAKRGQT